MKKIIFYPIVTCLAFVAVLSSCNKKQLVQRTHEDIQWHTKTVKETRTSNEIKTSVNPDAELPASVNSKPVLSSKQNTLLEQVVSEYNKKAESTSDMPISQMESVSSQMEPVSKKSAMKKLKKILRDYDTSDTEMNTLLLVLIAILLPPVAVGLVKGFTSGAFFLNILLWLLFYIPGLIHALIIVLGNSKTSS